MLTLSSVLKEYLELDDDIVKEVVRLLRDDWLQVLKEGLQENKSIENLLDSMMGR